MFFAHFGHHQNFCNIRHLMKVLTPAELPTVAEQILSTGANLTCSRELLSSEIL